MEWNASWDTGIPIVDLQHRSLVDQVAALLDRSRESRAEEMLDFLADYVITHFGTEELLQKTSKYPKAEEHKQEHDNFIAALVALRAEFDSTDDRLLMLMKITKAALGWLDTHIKGSDREFGAYFKASGLAPSPPPRD